MADVWIKKISIINFKDHRLLLNERNKLLFKWWHKNKNLIIAMEVGHEAHTLDKNKDIDFEWFYWQKKTLF